MSSNPLPSRPLPSLRFERIAVALGLALTVSACGSNSRAKCEEICSWWKQSCTGESLESCLDDCRWASEAAASVIDRCVEGNGWGTPSTCQSASCCVRFVYWDDQYQRQCL